VLQPWHKPPLYFMGQWALLHQLPLCHTILTLYSSLCWRGYIYWCIPWKDCRVQVKIRKLAFSGPLFLGGYR
jgi:hypothetical protein